MTAQQTGTIVFTINATSVISSKRFVTYAGAQAGAGTGGNGEVVCGVADHDAVLGENTRIVRGPTAMVETGAVIDGTEPRLKTDAQGRAIPWTTGAIVAARLKQGQAATGIGQLIEVYPMIEG